MIIPDFKNRYELQSVTNNIKNYFRNLHDITCNQKYAKTLPYSFHLDNVYKWANNFRDYWHTDAPTYLQTLISIYGHDSIEDARLTFNDIFNLRHELMEIPMEISVEQRNSIFLKSAKTIYACTEEKGTNRYERHSDKFYTELIEDEIAVFVKLCDLLANSTFSLNQCSSMFNQYKKEWPRTQEFLLSKPNLNKYSPIYNFINSLFNLTTNEIA